jgi:hypothetical protein
MSGGNQPANISVLNRRYSISPLLITFAMKYNPQKTGENGLVFSA